MSRHKRACLLTGPPGTGKTTLIREALAQTQARAGGFYTEEIREGGIRQGFQIVTLEGKTVPLARVDFPSPFRVSKYGVDVNALERVGVAALRKALAENDLVVVDEIGKMELLSSAFKEVVSLVLESPKRLLGTIMLAPHPWADTTKAHPQVSLLLVSRHNREQVLNQVCQWLKSSSPT